MVIDNFSRRILAWRVTERLQIATTVAILQEAASGAVSVEDTPTVVADSGVENVNACVDRLIQSGMLSRVLALKDVTFSNSMIEAWWRVLKQSSSPRGFLAPGPSPDPDKEITTIRLLR